MSKKQNDDSVLPDVAETVVEVAAEVVDGDFIESVGDALGDVAEVAGDILGGIAEGLS